LAESIKKNEGLHVLDLSSNILRDDCIPKLASAVESNKTLKELRLCNS